MNALNSSGLLTGYFFIDGVTFGEAFLYDAAGLHPLGTLGGFFSEGLAINSAGKIVGDSMTASGASDALLYDGSSLVDIGSLGGSASSAGAINEAGQIIGTSLLPGDAELQSFLYSNGTITPFGTFGGNFSAAFALNNQGVAVGESSTASGDIRAFAFENGALHDLGTLGGSYAAAFSINDAGLVVGESSLASGRIHPFIYSGGAMVELGDLGGDYSGAYFINSSNQIAGVSSIASGAYHGFFFENGVLNDLGTFGGDTYPNALNNRGQVVGQSSDSDGVFHAFFWEKGNFLALDSILPTNSGWVLENATLINDAGRIVGLGSLNGVQQWFILDFSAGNRAPSAVADGDRAVECGTLVMLDGSGSTDPDGDALTYEWTSAGSVIGTDPTLSGYFALGTNVVTLKVSDPCGSSAVASVTVVVNDSVAPSISVPGVVQVEAGNNCQAVVPDVSTLVVASDNCSSVNDLRLTQTPAPGALVGLGHNPIEVTVTDAAGNSASGTIVLDVVDKTAPVIVSAPGPLTVSVGNDCHGIVPNVLANIVATDACTPADGLVMVQDPPAGASVEKGAHTIDVVVMDAAGNQASVQVALTVKDTTAPIVQAISVTPDVLSPPNHQMVPVAVTISATDNCDQSPMSRIVSVTCNEPVLAGEIQITGPLTANLAATRNGGGGGRVYTLTVRCCDSSGNSSLATVTVTVPQGNK